MIFTSIEFILFFTIVFILLKIMPTSKERAWKFTLLGASYFFYGYWNWKLIFILLLVTVVNYITGNRIGMSTSPKVRKNWLTASIVFNLSILGLFKYYAFFINSLKVMFPLGAMPFDSVNIILPIGISFYIFQTITYAVDIYRGKIAPAKLIDFALFVAYFPKLIVGPIARAAEFLPQLSKKLSLTGDNFSIGTRLFIIGCVKKSLLADSLAIFVNEVFSNINLFDSITLMTAILAYAFQIYYDFSGYSDMAIGISKTLGIDLPSNFQHPYKSKNITEFWRRWHISLSSWLRDYLYIPLGGNRKGVLRTYTNIFITFALCGLWHGAGFNFIVWGILHGIALILHKLVQPFTKKIESSFATPFAVLLTFFVVYTGWIFFRASNFLEAIHYIMQICSFTAGVRWIHISFYLIVPISIIWQFIPEQEAIKEKYIGFNTLTKITGTIALLMLLLLFSPIGSTAFIYFQF